MEAFQRTVVARTPEEKRVYVDESGVDKSLVCEHPSGVRECYKLVCVALASP